MALIPQYNMLIRTSRGALHKESVFLIKKSLGERVMSARSPNTKVAYATVSPKIVKYCQCQPYESLIMLGKSTRYLYESEKDMIPVVCTKAETPREGEERRCRGCRAISSWDRLPIVMVCENLYKEVKILTKEQTGVEFL